MLAGPTARHVARILGVVVGYNRSGCVRGYLHVSLFQAQSCTAALRDTVVRVLYCALQGIML
jgi:hypothetical protein